VIFFMTVSFIVLTGKQLRAAIRMCECACRQAVAPARGGPWRDGRYLRKSSLVAAICEMN